MGLFATRVKSRMKANKNMHAKKYNVEQRRWLHLAREPCRGRHISSVQIILFLEMAL